MPQYRFPDVNAPEGLKLSAQGNALWEMVFVIIALKGQKLYTHT